MKETKVNLVMLQIPFELIGAVQGCHVDSRKQESRLGVRCGPIIVMCMQYPREVILRLRKEWHGSPEKWKCGGLMSMYWLLNCRNARR